ncbi:MAG: hypothetical protein ACYC3S_02500 [Chloroflexota bacterium]
MGDARESGTLTGVPYVTQAVLEGGLRDFGLLTERVAEAVGLARLAHGAAVRDDETPYLEEHVFPVALEAARYAVKAFPSQAETATLIALLHDVLEDSDVVDAPTLAARYGDEVAEGVVTLTKAPRSFWGIVSGARERRYLAALGAAPAIVQVVKIFDCLNNLACLRKAGAAKRRRYIVETRAFHLPLAQSLDPELSRRIEDQLAGLERAGKR